MMYFRQFVSIPVLLTSLILGCTVTQAVAQETERFSGSQGYSGEIEQTTLAARIPVNCPSGIERRSPSRTVLQVIDLEVHRWLEYDIEGEALCIIQQRPSQKILSAEETAELMRRSTQWQEQQPDPELMEIWPADHPAVSAPPASAHLRLAPEGWIAPHGPDTEHLPDPPGSRGQQTQARVEAEVPDSAGQSDWDDDAAQRVPVGDDERTRINLTTVQNFPWNTIGYHVHRYPNESTYRCTAFLVGPHLALTNGHCIYNDDRGGYLRAAEFSPGQFQEGQGEPIIRPFGTLPAYNFRTNSGYVNDGLSIYDYGALQFTRSFSGITTYMPLVFDDPGANIVNTSGYPARVHLGTPDAQDPTFAQWYSFSSETSTGGTNDRLLYHDADTSSGHSGSPLWRLVSQERRVIAIHCCGSSSAQINWGPRLVSANQTLIQSWLDWTPPANPGSGDDFGELSSTNATGSWTSSNVGATLQLRESDHCTFQGGRSMWRSWTSPVSRPVEFFMTDTNFDVLLGAYTGNSVAFISEVACDGSGGTDNAITFKSVKGQTYHIAVDGFSGAEGNFRLNWRVAPPPNDDFANAWTMGSTAGMDEGDNYGATSEPGEPDVCGFPTDSTVWWTFTAPAEPGTLAVDTTGSSFDVLLAASTGTSVGNLTEVACDGSPGSNNNIEFGTLPGTVYRIAVAGWSSTMGDIQLNWTWQASGDEVFSDRFE